MKIDRGDHVFVRFCLWITVICLIEFETSWRDVCKPTDSIKTKDFFDEKNVRVDDSTSS